MNNDLAKLVITAASTRSFTQDFRKAVAEIEKRSGLSRRSFLAGLVGTAGAVAAGSMLPAAVDPEKILWTKKPMVMGVDLASGPDQLVITMAEFEQITARDEDFVKQYMLGSWPPEDELAVTRYVGKQNFGNQWEPHGTRLDALVEMNIDTFKRTLAKARSRFDLEARYPSLYRYV